MQDSKLDDIYKCILVIENYNILLNILLNCIHGETVSQLTVSIIDSSIDLAPNWQQMVNILQMTYLLFLISMLCHRQATLESKGDKLSSSAECRIPS